MIKLNDYLYSGYTVLKILHYYSADLRAEAQRTRNQIDLAHAEFLEKQIGILEHNDFLASQSRRIREFYKYMAHTYPFLAFTFKGRIKSLIRSEQKFNGYIVSKICNFYIQNHDYPSVEELKDSLGFIRDLIAYRIVISFPRCNLKPGQDLEKTELDYLYRIADEIPAFLDEHGGFRAVLADTVGAQNSPLSENVRPFFKDFVKNPTQYGYKALHVTFFDTETDNCFELQLRTKQMDDFAEIGPANHLGYEKRQDTERARRHMIQEGECVYFDQALERGRLLQDLELSKLDVNMFSAANNSLINDGCGLYRGRQISPYEHLSRFQNDIID